MSKASDRYRDLSDALNEHVPPCTDDPRFILEPHQIAPAELTHIGLTICRPCPLRQACRDYAETAKPPAGIWAGRTYPERRQR